MITSESEQELPSLLAYPLLVYNFNVVLICSGEYLTSLAA